MACPLCGIDGIFWEYAWVKWGSTFRYRKNVYCSNCGQLLYYEWIDKW